MRNAQLIVEPDDGVAPIVNAFRQAKKTIDLTIFRFDHKEIARALEEATGRGVQIRALIAPSNRGGTHDLRRLEWSLLALGVTVSRASETFARYHPKMLVVDDHTLHVNAFNFTRQDLKSRSFGIVTTNAQLVHQAMRLFEADRLHRPFLSGPGGLVVSPDNAREQLEAFVRGARDELLIYDSKLADARMVRLLEARIKAHVEVRVIGRVQKHCSLHAAKLQGRRLHLSAIIRDGSIAFIGSQGLHRSELDARREVGVFVDNVDLVQQMRLIFERDWPPEIAIVGHSATVLERR